MARQHQLQPYPSTASGRTSSPPSGARLRQRGRRILAGTAAVALLLVGTTACGEKTGSTDSKSSSSPTPKEPFAPAQLAQSWKTPAVEGSPLRTALMTTWHTKAAYYVGRGTGVEILDTATGKKLGVVTPPEPDMHPCGMTEDLTADGIGAIAWLKGDPEASGASCDRVSLVDTRNGNAILWTKQVSGAPLDGKPLTNDTIRLTFIDGNLLAVMTPNTVVGVHRNGNEAWTWRNPGVPANQYVLNWDMTAHGDRLMVMIGMQGGGWRYWMATLDTKGKELAPEPVPMSVPMGASVKLLDGAAMTALLTPAVGDKDKKPEIVTFTREGSIARVIPLASTAGPAQLYWSSRLGRHHYHDIAVHGSTAYFVAGDPASDTAPAQIIALNLATGATKWTQPVSTITTPRFLGADDDSVYVLGGKASQDMNVYAYSTKDGTKTQISTVKAPDVALSMPGLSVDYNAGSLALTEPARGRFGTVMFRSPTP
ncbi:PQQ-binding-like beta-propeller repeat protein [Streptomyces virginiae]|uniref:outer membrane protein assembly factor BamB family protein n=1 Tax=Streptomyces virginiae TaxID=1961 RepID=UPI00364534F8